MDSFIIGLSCYVAFCFVVAFIAGRISNALHHRRAVKMRLHYLTDTERARRVRRWS